ncbi:hypothetical protein LOAG_00831 [Loa loa]|uniref:Uncharacterized protein n=1 Tax=Loa loa TaxID=7209 RepID=A0A1S0UAB7_LOALO|nr:hypothetical protein LOAG_00831 [Loa loa]EFO27652.2 hypothetical protein LOAG_00831 [Loa loa]
MENNDFSNTDFSVPGYQGPSNCKQKQLGSLEACPSIIGDEFSGSSEDEYPDIFLPKTFILDHNYVSQAEVDVGNGVGREENLKPSHNSTDFDEFSDFSDEFEKENHPKLDALKTNEKNQFSSYLGVEFSSSDDTEFSSTNDANFPHSNEQLITVFKNVPLDDFGCQFRSRLFPKDDTAVLVSYFYAGFETAKI